jgi:C1A family cysteine protease
MPDIPEVDLSTIYDATEDAEITTTEQPDYKDEEEMSDEEKEKQEEEEKKDSEERLEKALAAANTSAMFAESLAQAQMLDAMNLAINMNTYYAASIKGGTYNDSVSLVDSKLPENRKGLRNGLAQQLLHEKMIDMQYDR